MQDKTAPMDPTVAPSAVPTRKRNRNPFILTGVLIVIVAGVGGAVWLVKRPPATPGAPGAPGPGGPGRGGGRRPATTVGVAAAKQADIPITIEGLGTVTSAATVTVTPQVSGVITQILYKEGQTVQKGQTLAIIDPRPYQMVLNQAQGQLARDQAQLVNARTQLQRDQTLLTQDSIARQDVDTQDALVKQLQGTITADQAAVGSAQLNLGFSRIIAPVSGKVGLRPVDLGNFISAGAATGVAVITQVTPIDVEFTIPQVDLPRVQENAAHCALPVIALDQTKTITLDRGVFSTLDNRIDTTTGTVKAKARFTNSKGNLFPNQFVNINLNIETLHNVVTVPVTAVRTGPQGDFVWVVQPDKTVKLRLITRGPATADSTSITKGLMVGEQVITEGGDRLTEGAHVQLPGARPAGAGGRGGRGHRGAAGSAPAAAGAAPGVTPAPQSSAETADAAAAGAGGGVGEHHGHRSGSGADQAVGGDVPASHGQGQGQSRGNHGGSAGGGHRTSQGGCAPPLIAATGDQAGHGKGQGHGGRNGGQGGDKTAPDAQAAPQRQGDGQGRGRRVGQSNAG